MVSLVRIQQITETGKGIPRVKIRWPHYNRTKTYKVGDLIPQSTYTIESIGNDYTILTNGVHTFKMYVKNEFRFENDLIKQDQCYHFDKTIKNCEEI